MNPALLFLLRRSFVNGVRSRILRLKSPRYLLPFVVGLLYFVLVFGVGGWRDRPAGPSPARDRVMLMMVEWGTAAMILMLAAASWLLPAKGPPIPFLEPEVALLFPAPLHRKELVRYKLLDLQKGNLFVSLFFALLLGMQSGSAASALRIFLGSFLVFNLLSLHQIGARLTRASLTETGASGWKRQGFVLGILAAMAFVVIRYAPPFPGLPGRGQGAGLLLRWLEDVGASPAGWALMPFRLPGRMFTSPDLAGFLLNALPVAATAVVMYLWVLRSDAAFEEAAADYAGVLARRIDDARKGKISFTAEEGKPARRSPFRLAPTGPPETAFVWKSATEALRHVPLRLVLLVFVALTIAVPIVLGKGSRRAPPGEVVEPVPVVALMATVSMLGVAGLLVFGGPLSLGSSLRGDLDVVETLKTLPVTGARLVRASLAGTVVPIAVLQAVLVIGAAAAFPSTAKVPVTLAWRIGGACALILVLPALTAVSSLVDAAAALYFPAWVRPGQAQMQGGIEGMGFGIVTMIGKAVFLFLGGGIPLAAGGVVVAIAGLAGGPVLLPGAVMAGAVVTALLVHGEIWVASQALGRRFEAMDPAAEGILQ